MYTKSRVSQKEHVALEVEESSVVIFQEEAGE